jgi:site-specific recombinase XerD
MENVTFIREWKLAA